MTPEQKQHWHEAKRQTKNIKDKLGMPIDQGILNTVVIMRLMGINTTGSCAGHIERVTDGPYVMFESMQNSVYKMQYRQVKEEDFTESRRVCYEAYKVNLLERLKLLPFLDAFYRQRSTDYSYRLVIQDVGFKTSHLLCQNADLAYLMDGRERNELLLRNQQEMRDFTEYLKLCFYEKELDTVSHLTQFQADLAA